MFGIFPTQKTDKLMLVFDVGSSSVGGALFFAQSSGTPKIIFSIREPIILEHNLSPERLFTLTLKALSAVSEKMSKAGFGVPFEVFAVLSSPWHVSETRVIRYKKSAPFVFTTKLANDLLKKEVSVFEEEHFAKYKDTKQKIRPIELKNIKISLNGYEAAAPLNQKTTELEMHIFLSMSADDVLKQIEETVGKYFSHRKMKFSSFALSSFTVVRDVYARKNNFLLIDISGEVTDISMVKNNVLQESISFPIGQNFMIRETSSVLGCSLDEADSCVALITSGHASSGTKKKIDAVVGKLKDAWLRNFQESLANLSSDISVPSTIYLSVDDDFAEFFSETIKTEQFSQYTLADSKFEIIFLNTALLNNLVSFEGNVARDPFIMVATIYINRFLAKI